jgi:hypothetical protein
MKDAMPDAPVFLGLAADVIANARGEGSYPKVRSTDVVGILDTIDVPIVVVGRDCKVTRFNRMAEEALGQTGG